jgi:hypothetical protein
MIKLMGMGKTLQGHVRFPQKIEVAKNLRDLGLV